MASGCGVADLRPRAAVERGVRQMEQHVDDARALRPVEQLVEQLGVLRPDAGQRAGGGEQRIEQGGAHGAFIRAERAGAKAEGLAGRPDAAEAPYHGANAARQSNSPDETEGFVHAHHPQSYCFCCNLGHAYDRVGRRRNAPAPYYRRAGVFAWTDRFPRREGQDDLAPSLRCFNQRRDATLGALFI